MPLQKAHKRRRRAFLAELTQKRHRLSSSDTVADTVPVSLDAETGPVVADVDTVPVSLDAETGPVTVESSATIGEFYLV